MSTIMHHRAEQGYRCYFLLCQVCFLHLGHALPDLPGLGPGLLRSPQRPLRKEMGLGLWRKGDTATSCVFVPVTPDSDNESGGGVHVHAPLDLDRRVENKTEKERTTPNNIRDEQDA